jgi:tetratricopeptide (TPR) repeat protein
MSTQGAAEAATSGAAPRRGSRWIVFVCLGGLAAAAWLGWFVWFREQPPLPAIDFTAANPRLVQVIQEARDAVRANPRSAKAWGRLGMVLLAHEYWPEARVCFDQAAARDPKSARWLYLDAQARFRSDPLRAIALLEKAVAVDGDDPVVRLFLGEQLLEQGRLDEAEQHLLVVLNDEQMKAWGHVRLAQLALRRDQLPKALGHAQLAQEGDRSFKALHVLLSEIYFRMGDARAAESEDQKARRLPPAKWLDPYLAQVDELKVEVLGQLDEAKLLGSQGQSEQEIALLEGLVRSHPQSLPARISLAQAHAKRQNWEAAAAACRQALDLHPDDDIALNLLAACLRKQGKLPQAVETYQKSLRQNPQNAETRYQLGSCYYQLKQTAAAMDELRTAVRLRPNYADAWRELGQFHLQENDPEALVCLRRAVELAPEDGAAQRLLAEAQKRLEKSKPPK